MLESREAVTMTMSVKRHTCAIARRRQTRSHLEPIDPIQAVERHLAGMLSTAKSYLQLLNLVSDIPRTELSARPPNLIAHIQYHPRPHLSLVSSKLAVCGAKPSTAAHLLSKNCQSFPFTIADLWEAIGQSPCQQNILAKTCLDLRA